MANLGSPLSRLEFACFRFKRICLAFDVCLSVCLTLCLLEGLSSSLKVFQIQHHIHISPVHERSVWKSDRFLETNKTSLDPPLIVFIMICIYQLPYLCLNYFPRLNIFHAKSFAPELHDGSSEIVDDLRA